MTNTKVTPKQVNSTVRPESRGWVRDVMDQAPTFTELWGSYRGFVAVITIAALLTLIFVRSEAVIAVIVLVLAAIWTPLVAKKLGLLD
jgi:hypothetical protein